jgi:5-methylcytosine-specific restriction endonuclease McrA
MRPNSSQRGYGSTWRRLRAAFIKANPLCATPGCGRPSSHADHVVPRSRGGQDVWSNLQPLCPSCHARKTAAGDGGFGNRMQAGAAVRVPGCTPDGTPTDPLHPWNTPRGRGV